MNTKGKIILIGMLTLIITLAALANSFAALTYQETYKSQVAGQPILVVVNSSIYDAIYNPSLKQYISDLEAEGYGVTLTKYTSGTAEELKEYLKLFPGLKGALFIGDLPIAWFEIGSDFGQIGYTNFPCDLFYTDLDGNWQDTDNNGMYDTHTGNMGPEIWLGRITTYLLTSAPSMDQVGFINNYFSKNHAYRTRVSPIIKQGLVYEDERINNWCPGCQTTLADAEIVYQDINSNFNDVKFKVKETGEEYGLFRDASGYRQP